MIADERFSAPSRLLHWLMALLVLAMLFIGVGMAASASGRYSLLLSVHRPLGIAILVLVAIRFINRLINRPPPLPATLPPLQRLAAKASHFALYALMFALPLVGWGMLSAGGYPIVLYGPVELPPFCHKAPSCTPDYVSCTRCWLICCSPHSLPMWQRRCSMD